MERGGDLENQLERVRSENKALQDRLRDAESQISQLKSAEAGRRRSDEEIRQFLEDEIRRLRQTVEQTEGEKREMEERIAVYEERINFLQKFVEYYRDDIKSLWTELQEERQKKEEKLQEEMSRHAPLYGNGLDALSMKKGLGSSTPFSNDVILQKCLSHLLSLSLSLCEEVICGADTQTVICYLDIRV